MSQKKDLGKQNSVVPGGSASAQAAPSVAANDALSRRDIIFVVLYGILLFLSMTAQTGLMALALSCFALVSLICKKGRKPLPTAISLVGFVAYAVLFGISCAATPFGERGYAELTKFMAAASMTVILLTRFEKKHTRALLWAFAAVGAAIALICVDMDASTLVYKPFSALMNLLEMDFDHLLGNMNSGRITGIYNDANVSGCLHGLAALVGLYLMESYEDAKHRLAACFLTGVSAMGFFLSMSRGAILAFGVACVVWLVAAGKGNRILLFFRMLICAGVTVVLSAVSMGRLSSGSFLPTGMTLLCGVVIFGLDWLLSRRLTDLLTRHAKAAVIAVAMVVVLIGAYGVAAMTVTGPATIPGNRYDALSRTVKLPAGDYTLTGSFEELDKIEVIWVEHVGASTQKEGLYAGAPDAVSFTVPEGKGELRVGFFGTPGARFSNAVFSNGKELVLRHPLMPLFVENRLQDSLLSSSSLWMRVQYDVDALKIFATSPLWGRGIGSTEELYSSVQPFHYETKFAHCHILQVMSDMGLLGLAAFVTFLGGALWLLIRALRGKEESAMWAMLLAVWVLINVHSLVELNFGIRAFQCYAYALLLLPVLAMDAPLFAGESKAAREKNHTVSVVLLVVLLIFTVVFTSMVALRRWAVSDANDFETTSYRDFLDRTELYIKLNPFDRVSYISDYLSVALSEDRGGAYALKVQKYVNELERIGSYSALNVACIRYYAPTRRYEDMFRCSRKVLEAKATYENVWASELTFYRDTLLPVTKEENLDRFITGVVSLADQYDEQNARLTVPLELDSEWLEFMQLCRDAAIGHDTSAYKQLLAMAQTE